jgi:hypothetical protein
MNMFRTSITGLLKSRRLRWSLPALIGAAALLATFFVQGGQMVPYRSKTVGQVTTYFNDAGAVTKVLLQESGIGTHLGNFTVAGKTHEDGYLYFTITCASKDELYGVVVGQDGNTIYLQIYDGTGRFRGASGSITATLTYDPPVGLNPQTIGYTAIGTGSISTVGSNK